MKKFLSKIWKDPVWSKIIATMIMGSITILFSNLIEEWTYCKGSLLVLIGIIIILLLCIRLLLIKIQKLYYYDREYEILKIHYFYTLNPSKKSLDLEAVYTRKVKCLKGKISHMTLGFSVDECFHDHKFLGKAILLKQERSDNKSIIIHAPHKNTKSDLKFRAEFFPPLVEGETAYFECKLVIQEFRFATIELLKEAMKNSVVINRNFEYNSFQVSYPIKQFEYKIEFDNKCSVNSADLEVTRYTDLFIEEDLLMKKSNKMVKRYNNNNGNYIIEMKRNNPPLKAKYKWKWYPPKESELNA